MSSPQKLSVGLAITLFLANIWESVSCNVDGTYIAYSSSYRALYEVEASQPSPSSVDFECTVPSHGGYTCPWSSGKCVKTPDVPLKPNRLSCTFTSSTKKVTHENATIDYGCEKLAWTDPNEGPWIKHDPTPTISCEDFIQNVSCNGCPGGCDNPNSCIACAWNYRTSGRGTQEVLSACKQGNTQIRAVCNATKGRVLSSVITVTTGKLQGFVDVNSSHTVFRGIPFAAPPIGDLRWRPPQPVTPWEGVRNASEFGATCPQLGPQWTSIGGVSNASENCLFLNVYAPKKTIPTSDKTNNSTKLPVLVYFPAGQFMWGSANDAENWIAPQTPAGANVIVVTGNYRLGALGYLALDELRSRDPHNSTGNYGSQDQRAVLTWCKNNIAAFGGDPNNVVLWGESAGAAAVTAHLSMPKSFPFYSKAIMESGAFQTWSYKTFSDASANARMISKFVGCHNDTSGPIDIDCLLKVDPSVLVYHEDDGMGAAHVSYTRSSNGSRVVSSNETLPFMDTIDKSMWAPVIDGVELFAPPAQLLREGKTANVPILLGTNRDEGSTFTGNQTGIGDGTPTADSFYYHWIYSPEQYASMRGGEGTFSEGVVKTIDDFTIWASQMFGEDVANQLAVLYAPDKVQPGDINAPPTEWWWSISLIIGDFVLSCPARRAAVTHTGHGNDAFVYHFNHAPVRSINQDHTELYGSFHGSEVPFVFFDEYELDAQEQDLSTAMVQYWVNFAWTGNPNTPPPTQTDAPTLPVFPLFNASNDQYVILGDLPVIGNRRESRFRSLGITSNVTIVSHLKKARCDFWDSFANTQSQNN